MFIKSSEKLFSAAKASANVAEIVGDAGEMMKEICSSSLLKGNSREAKLLRGSLKRLAGDLEVAGKASEIVSEVTQKQASKIGGSGAMYAFNRRHAVNSGSSPADALDLFMDVSQAEVSTMKPALP